MPWYSFRINLPSGVDWEDATFHAMSCWGNAAGGSDHWGWPDAGPMSISRPLHDNGNFYCVVNLEPPSAGQEPVNGYMFAVSARASLRGGHHAVIAAFHKKGGGPISVTTQNYQYS